jgi:alanyl-tRNA synthetase
MLSQEIRRGFLNYFKKNGHTIVSSSPVIPHDDPTLLFTNAGMNQFKDVFLGKAKRDYERATTTQKCIRAGGKHNDFENVGHTTRHCTFFEMLGNFSFGDYFKEEAIKFAWEVTTQIFNFDPDRIWPTVFKDDDEAYELWKIYVPEKRIVRFDEKENFWAMGDTGPCGPCSELLYDRGDKYSNAKTPYEDYTGERFLEFWNLVFMQYMKSNDGLMTPLPKQSIDTGAGLERIALLKMGVDTVFQTDILRTLIAKMEEISKIKYNEHDKKLAPPFQVIADHIRSLSFSIADGAQPSNTDRGYILRKILRRAVRYGRMLNIQKPFLKDLVPTLIELMGDDFTELKTAKNKICEILTLEEEAFIKTLHRGGNLLSQVIDQSKNKKISGEDAFKLKDTYGFPIDEIMVIAKDENLEVDLKKYNSLEEEAKNRSRKAHASKDLGSTEDKQTLFAKFLEKNKPNEFVGFENSEILSTIKAIISNDEYVDSLEENQKGIIMLDKTPFYPEKGGQIGDTGEIFSESDDKIKFVVENTKTPIDGIIAHIGHSKYGKLKVGDKVVAKINITKRKSIENNHSGTHLLHFALHKVLGDHIRQAGSLVDENYFRLDFNHHKQISLQELREIESLVNEKIRQNTKISSYEKSYEEVQKNDEIKMFFGDKYGKTVRVIDIDFSKELCGGCHAKFTGNLGYFKILKESSIAAGVRRIEAVTGKYAEEAIYLMDDKLIDVAAHLKTQKPKIIPVLENLIDDNKNSKQSLKEFQSKQIEIIAKKEAKNSKIIKNLNCVIKVVEIPAKELPILAQNICKNSDIDLVVLATKSNDKCFVFIKTSERAIKNKIFANDLIKAISPIIEGGGGGKKDSAQAGGKNLKNLKKALDTIEEIISK